MSYYRVLGMDQEPFSTSPDPAFFYESAKHRAVLANLLIEFRLKRGLSVVLGDIGTGKTTLGRKLIQMLREREGFSFHMILDATYPSEDLFFDGLVRTLGIEMPASSVKTLVDYREVLERYLFRKGVREHQTVVLLIDEAHKLSKMSLETLRVLLNYETNDAKLLQLVLLGQMELMPLLLEMPNLTDRISMKCLLEPLDLGDTTEMVQYRLRKAGYRSRLPLFTEGALIEIHDYSEGYPRRTAMLCHRALRTLVMQRGTAVDEDLVRDIIHDEVTAGWSQSWSQRKTLQKNSY